MQKWLRTRTEKEKWNKVYFFCFNEDGHQNKYATYSERNLLLSKEMELKLRSLFLYQREISDDRWRMLSEQQLGKYE